MDRTSPTSTLTVKIKRPPAEVISFLLDPANLTRWMGDGRKRDARRLENGDWLVELPQGPHVFWARTTSEFGKLEVTLHEVGSPKSTIFVEVVACEAGSEVDWTVRQVAGTDDAQFASAIHLGRSGPALAQVIPRGLG